MTAGMVPGALTNNWYVPATLLAVAFTKITPLPSVVPEVGASAAPAPDAGFAKLTVTPCTATLLLFFSCTCNTLPNAVFTSVVWLLLAGKTVKVLAPVLHKSNVGVTSTVAMVALI